MALIAKPTPRPNDSGVDPSRQKTDRPATVEIKWPPMTLRGWARGLCGIAKTSTQLAPNGAINKFAPNPALEAASTKIVVNPPIPAITDSPHGLAAIGSHTPRISSRNGVPRELSRDDIAGIPSWVRIEFQPVARSTPPEIGVNPDRPQSAFLNFAASSEPEVASPAL
jgi:hypothetical protein